MALPGKDLGALVGQLGLDTTQWDRAFNKMQNDMLRMEARAQTAAQNIGRAFNRAGRRLESVGRNMSRYITLPIVGLAGLAVREFGNFDQAMTQSLAIMGDVSQAMREDMSNAAREVARTTSLSAKDAAESYFFLASAGLNAEQSIAALPQVAQFAQAGMFDMATATDLATDAQSALGMVSKDTEENLTNLTKITDVLVKANTLANASVEQFATSLTREAGSTMKSFNMDMEEGVAVLAAFADQGIKGEKAGMGFSRVIRLMTQAANNNKKELNELGLQIFDTEGNLRNMADIVENLENVLGSMTDQQRTAALESIGFSARVQGMILPLLGTSDAIRQYEKDLRVAGGVTKEVADNQMNSFNEQLKLMWDNVRDIGISFGETLTPALRRLVQWLKNATEEFQNLEHEAKVRVIGIAGLFAVGGPLLLALGKALRLIGGFFLILNGKLAIVTATLIGTVAVGQWVADNWGNILDGMEDRSKQWAQNTQKNIGGPLGKLQDAFRGLAGFDPLPDEDATGATGSAGGDETKLTSLQESFSNAMGLMKGSLEELLGFGFDDLYERFESLFDFEEPAKEAAGTMEEYAGRVEGANRRIGESFEQTADRIAQSMTQNVGLVQDVGQKIPDSLQETGDAVIDISDALQSTISNAVSSFAESIGEMIASGASGGDFFNSLLKLVADFAVQFGKIVVGMGVAALEMEKVLLNPVGAIVAGGALIALGTAAKSLISKGPGGGGNVSGGSSTFQPSARSEAADQEVVFRIGNKELVGVLQQGNRDAGRVGRRINVS